MKKMKKSPNKSIPQTVPMPKSLSLRKISSKQKPNGLDRNSRTFETRFLPRYKKIPPMPSDLAEPTFSESSNKILQERYLLKGGNLEVIESVAERFWHIAYDIASSDFDFGRSAKDVEELSRKFYTMMVRQEFLPNSPTIMNAGKQNGLQYSACFVLPIGDSLPEIFDSVKYAALIHQTGGGTGFAFSRLRPAGSIVNTTGGVASGPVSFLRVFNAATESIKQGGTRRGANMGILRVDHPDILEFIRCKAELDDLNKPIFEKIAPFLPDENTREYVKTVLLDKQISNFNISVAVTDKFMQALEKGAGYELVAPQSGEVVGELNAREVFDEIIERAWKTGDPGLIFIERINHSPANPVPSLETIESTNPCGEQPLAPWDACNLGSINLGKFVKESNGKTDMDWERLKEAAEKAVHFLDNVVQANPFSLKQIYDEVHQNRRIGLGVMGFADMLFKLKIPYNSDQALKLAGKIMKFINETGHVASEKLALQRGAFPSWEHSIYAEKHSKAFANRPKSSAYIGGKKIRNSTITTIAPTGTISIIGDCSSGIEPVFALAYIHKAKAVGDKYRILTIANQTFTEIAKREGFYSDDLAANVLEHGSVKGLKDVPEDWQRVFVTAPEIDPVWHVKMQAAFQSYTDNGVSKTINLPNSATKDDVALAYKLAYETGCNGITIYRDGSKSTQVLNVSSSLQPSADKVSEDPSAPVAERPMILRGRTYKISTPVGECFITVNRDEHDQPFEVFVTVGRAGMHTMADAEAMGRLVSLSLRLARGAKETDPKAVALKIVNQLRGIGGASSVGFGKNRVMSLADAIAKVLAEDLALNSESSIGEQVPLTLTNGYTEEVREDLPLSSSDPAINADLCPECGSASFVMEEGCKKCHSCGYSMC